jgi:hypothetical protein
VPQTASVAAATGRFDARVAAGHELLLSASVTRRRRSPVDPSRHDAPESWQYESGTTPAVRVSHYWIAGPLALTSRVSYTDRGFAYELQHASLSDVQPIQDQLTQGWSRSGRVTRFDHRVLEGTAEASWFATRAGWGDHRVTAGVRYHLDRDGKRSHVAGGATANLLRQVPSGATLYRVTDPANGRTQCYVRSSDPKFPQLLGQFVGVRGELITDAQLSFKVVEATSANVIDPARVNNGITAKVIPPSLSKGAETANTGNN